MVRRVSGTLVLRMGTPQSSITVGTRHPPREHQERTRRGPGEDHLPLKAVPTKNQTISPQKEQQDRHRLPTSIGPPWPPSPPVPPSYPKTPSPAPLNMGGRSACFLPTLLLLTTLFTLVLDARKQGGLMQYIASKLELLNLLYRFALKNKLKRTFLSFIMHTHFFLFLFNACL